MTIYPIKLVPRLSGSANADKTGTLLNCNLETLGLIGISSRVMNLWKWVRGEKETAYICLNNKLRSMYTNLALGGSILNTLKRTNCGSYRSARFRRS
jgi:hypothetical protein